MTLAKFKYAYFSAGVYLLSAVLFALGYLEGMGHGPNPFGFLFNVVFSVCHLLDFLPDLFTTENERLRFMLCVVEGVFFYAIIGYLVDVALARKKKLGSVRRKID